MAEKRIFFRCFIAAFPAIFLALTFLGLSPAKVAWYSMIMSFMISWVVKVLLQGSGRCVDSPLYGIEQRKRADRKRFMAEVDKARLFRRRGEWDHAIDILDQVLARNPKYVPALFMKAEILAESGGDDREVRRYLRLTMQNAAIEDKYFKWASEKHWEIVTGRLKTAR